MVDQIAEQPPGDHEEESSQAVVQEQEHKPTAREFARYLFLSPGQRDMAEQLDRDIKIGKFTGDMLAVARRLVGLTGDASYLLNHQNPVDLASELHEIPPMPHDPAASAEDLATMEDPVVAAFANLHRTQDSNDRGVNSAHVALIRRGPQGQLRVESPIGQPRVAYEGHALRLLQPPTQEPGNAPMR